jgi:hypothetical protein
MSTLMTITVTLSSNRNWTEQQVLAAKAALEELEMNDAIENLVYETTETREALDRLQITVKTSRGNP